MGSSIVRQCRPEPKRVIEGWLDHEFIVARRAFANLKQKEIRMKKIATTFAVFSLLALGAFSFYGCSKSQDSTAATYGSVSLAPKLSN